MVLLLLLLVFAVPLLVSIVLLGIGMAHLRDIEPQYLSDKKFVVNFPQINANLFYWFSSGVIRAQHVLIHRRKSDI